VVKAGGVLGINILNANQVVIAKHFAGQIRKDHPRFDGIETVSLVSGAPLIKHNLALLDCSVVKSIEIGETTIFFSEVLAAQTNGDIHEPLVYMNREWRKLS